MFLACSAILTAVVVLLSILARKAKMPIIHRVLHIRYVIFTIIYAIVVVASFSKILGLINKVMSIPFVKSILFFLIPQSNVSAAFYWFISLFCCIFLMLVFCILIHILKKIWINPLSKSNYLESNSIIEKIMNYIAGSFYRISDGGVFLPTAIVNVGQWIRVMRIVLGIIFLALSLLVGLYLQFGFKFIGAGLLVRFVKSVYMIPVVSYVVLEQIELFLAADIKKGERLIDTEHIDSTMIGRFDKLIDLFINAFGEKSLISHYKGNGREGVQPEVFSGIQEEQKERVENVALLEALCRNVQCVTNLASYHIDGLIDLINGNHLALFSPLWSEIDAYYLAYVQHQLEIGNTAIVICGTNQESDIIQERFIAVFKKMNVADPVWRVNKQENAVDGETDILICTEEEFLNNSIYVQYPNFSEKLKLVVVSNMYELLCREDAYFERLFNNLTNDTIQFVFYVSENNTDIRNEIQERISNKQVGLSEKPYFNSNTDVLLWRSESVYKPQMTISQRLYHDFGIAYTIAIIAASQDVPIVNVIAPGSIPIETYSNLVTEEYGKILMEDYLKRSSVNLGSVIKNNSYDSVATSLLPFNIVYDAQNNLLNVAKTWISCNDANTSVLNIISGPYMLRDYFASNISSLCVESTGLQLLVPYKSLDLHAPTLAMLLKMRNGVTFEELLEFAEKYAIQEDDIEKILKILLKTVFGDETFYDVYTNFSFKECENPEFIDDEFVYTSIVTLVDDDLYDVLCKKTEQFVRLVGAYECVLPINVKDVYNYFLPKQHVSFDGIRYIVTDISKGVVNLSIEETVDMEERYTTLFDITEFEKIKSYEGCTLSTEKMMTDSFMAKITRKIDAYYAYPGALLFNENSNTSLIKLTHPIVETKSVSCLHIMLKCPLDNCSEKVANTLCYAIKGAMETFLPENYKDIMVFSKLDMSYVCDGVMLEENNGFLPDPIPADLLTGFEDFEKISPEICRLIPHVAGSAIESNTAEEIHLYIAHFSETDTGVISAISNDLDRILLTVYRYLSWVEGQEGDLANYMRFGYKSTPEIFDILGTLFCLSKVIPKSPEPSETKVIIDNTGECCNFCGKAILAVSHNLDDGRIMCAECHNHITTEREEVRTLLNTAVELLEKHYSIKLPENISIKFKSASAIRKANITTNAVERVLGFYDSGKKELWVERGGPEPCVISTLVHELTHAWQFANINVNKIELKYLEGHSSYVEVECLRLLKQTVYADFLENNLLADQSEYGEGYRFWKQYLATESDKNIFNNIKEMF